MYKFCVIALLVCAASFHSFSQSNIEYDYDLAGNMIVRSVITLRSNAYENTDDEQEEQEKNQEDNNEEAYIGESTIILYPNPTKGNLKIEVQNLPQNSAIGVAVYSSQGQIVLHQEFSGQLHEIDISAQPKGIYFMHITIEGKQKVWKIILE